MKHFIFGLVLTSLLFSAPKQSLAVEYDPGNLCGDLEWFLDSIREGERSLGDYRKWVERNGRHLSFCSLLLTYSRCSACDELGESENPEVRAVCEQIQEDVKRFYCDIDDGWF